MSSTKPSDTLGQLLRDRRRESVDLQSDREDTVRRYCEAVSELFDQAGRWLAAYVEQGLVQLERTRHLLVEHHLGEYEVERLVVSARPSQLEFRPAGTLVEGARGSIDILSTTGTDRVLVLDGRGTWSLVGSPPEQAATPLDESAFRALIEELLE